MRGGLTLLLLLTRLTLLLLLTRLMLLLLRYGPIGCLQCRRGLHVAICRERPTGGGAGRAPMVDTRKLSSIGAGDTLILHLRPHGRRVLLMHRRQFRGPRSHLETARSSVETHTAAAVVPADRAAVDVMHHGGVDVVDRAVVVEVAATPVAALVAVAAVAEAVVDAAVVADVLTPIAGVEPVEVIPVAPVAGGPESALIRSLHPRAGHPIVAVWTPGPVAGRPQISVAGSLRLVVVGQGRWRLGSGVFRLLSVTRIILSLAGRLVIVASRIRRRRALRGVVTHRRRSALLIAVLRRRLSA